MKLPARSSAACLAGLVCAACLSACSPLYVLRAGYEEARILWHRQPIRALLQDDERIDAATREKLRLVLRVRGFAERELGFRVGESYTSISRLPTPPTIFVVSAAPRTRLEPYTWWFPIVGRVAYKGFFNADAAAAEARRLQAAGFDTATRTAAAFSTLGWFADPLLPHLLEYDSPTLANVVLHELFHNTFYLAGETAFNESLANFAGHRGAIAYFTREHGAAHEHTRDANDAWQAELAAAEFFARASSRLDALYAAALSEAEKLERRDAVFAQIRAEFESLSGTVIADFRTGEINNAVVLQYLTYLTDLHVFERAYRQNGRNLRRTLEAIRSAAAEAAQPFEAVRRHVEAAARESDLRQKRQRRGGDLVFPGHEEVVRTRHGLDARGLGHVAGQPGQVGERTIGVAVAADEQGRFRDTAKKRHVAHSEWEGDTDHAVNPVVARAGVQADQRAERIADDDDLRDGLPGE